MSKEKLSNVSSKYRDLPEQYYGGVSDLFVTPAVFSRSGPLFTLAVKFGKKSTWTDGAVEVKHDPNKNHLFLEGWLAQGVVREKYNIPIQPSKKKVNFYDDAFQFLITATIKSCWKSHVI